MKKTTWMGLLAAMALPPNLTNAQDSVATVPDAPPPMTEIASAPTNIPNDPWPTRMHQPCNADIPVKVVEACHMVGAIAARFARS